MKDFSPLALPTGVAPGPSASDEEGVVVTADLVESVVDRLLPAGADLKARPVADVTDALGRAGERFLDERDPLREEALRLLPGSAALSPEMARTVLDGMAGDWTRPRLVRLLSEEFPEPRCLDALARRPGGSDRCAMAVGPALCTQIVSGSVPGVGVSALIRSLLVKAPTLVKPGWGDEVLPVLFARALREDSPWLADALAVLYWRGEGGDEGASGENLARVAVSRAEVVVAYGADRTIASVRALAPPSARFVGYHHRVGVAVIGGESLAGPGEARAAAVAAARAVAVFERRGCVCPQTVFVEEGGAVGSEEVALLIARGLEELEEELPSPALDSHEMARLHQARGTAELGAASHGGRVLHGVGAAAWTVVVRGGEPARGEHGVGRWVTVRPFCDESELEGLLRPMGEHLQTVGYAGLSPERAADLTERLGRVGVSRVTPLESVSFPPPWWLHDGRAPLGELVRWVELER